MTKKIQTQEQNGLYYMISQIATREKKHIRKKIYCTNSVSAKTKNYRF